MKQSASLGLPAGAVVRGPERFTVLIRREVQQNIQLTRAAGSLNRRDEA